MGELDDRAAALMARAAAAVAELDAVGDEMSILVVEAGRARPGASFAFVPRSVGPDSARQLLELVRSGRRPL